MTAIGDYFFSNCVSLEKIILGEGLTVIPRSAFSVCSNLKEVVLGSKISRIEDNAFVYCTGLEELTLPLGIITLGEGVFASCKSLKSIVLPDSVTTLGDRVFTSCSALESVAIPDSVTAIGKAPFWGCGNMKSVLVGEGNPVYFSSGGALFDTGENKLIYVPASTSGHYTIPDGVIAIAESAFSECSKLTSVTIPDGVTEIPRNAFYRCSGLVEVNLPSTLTTIGSYAFANCAGLKQVAIPDSVTSIHGSAFRYCDTLTSIGVGEGNQAYSVEGGVLFDKHKTKLLRFPRSRGGEYTIPETVTHIDERAFNKNTALTSVTIGSKVTFIGMFAFEGCSNLASITFKGTKPPELPYDPEAFYGYQFHKIAGNAKIYVNKEATGFQKAFKGIPVVVKVSD